MFPESQINSELMARAVKLSQIEKELSLVCLTPPKEDCQIQTGFASDVLSDVLASASAGSLWVTTQTNLNVIAVASHVKIFTVVFSSGQRPGHEVLLRAVEEGIGLYSSAADTFEVVGKLFSIGLRGRF
ncbi:MAG: serine kinase [Candidatus Riflebacteria bacterium]|nr:serine kinase [Candidatus Riflebacteria bacterium]